MNITVNGAPVLDQCRDAVNLEELLLKLSRTTLPQDHLVGVVKVNGEEFSEQYDGQAREVMVKGIQEIEIATIPIEKFAAAAFSDCTVLIGKIIDSVMNTAELFRMYDESEANEQYSKVIDSLRALYQFIDSTQKTIGWDFTASMYQGKPVQTSWERLIEIVDELKQPQEEGDWVLLADLMEYELVPILTQWKEIFGEKAVSSQA